jgi:histidinol dehydrogenase
MNKIINPKKEEWSKILERPTASIEDIEQTVNAIFDDVKRNGDDAVKRYTSIFDGVELDTFLVSNQEIEEANKMISQDLKDAIEVAKANITAFHTAQKTEKIVVETMPGIQCWQEKRPIQKVGLYIPGGTAPLFSSVLMLAIPAKIAGCKEIILTTPPNKNGKIYPAIIYAAQLCGVTKIYKAGGIQAIAALTFGTESIEKVYKIFGPGNQFVTVAKQLATKYGVAIDMPAGPSELLVVADESANAEFVASDLLSQAEHGTDSQVILVTTSREKLKEVEIALETQINTLSRKKIAKEAINNSKLIYVETKEMALELINEYGPEHFIISTNNNEFYIKGVENTGSVFIGNYTPESAGDYATGTNHTLPTNGYSKAYSGVNLEAFLKSISFQKISEKGIQNIGKTIEVLAQAEGLDAHKNAVTLRLKSLEK